LQTAKPGQEQIETVGDVVDIFDNKSCSVCRNINQPAAAQPSVAVDFQPSGRVDRLARGSTLVAAHEVKESPEERRLHYFPMWIFVQAWNSACFRKCDPDVSPSNQFALNKLVTEALTLKVRYQFRITVRNAADVEFFALAILSAKNADTSRVQINFCDQIKAAAAYDAAAA
jgi:hypothetical protein